MMREQEAERLAHSLSNWFKQHALVTQIRAAVGGPSQNHLDLS
jgi:hypothetical protein